MLPGKHLSWATRAVQHGHGTASHPYSKILQYVQSGCFQLLSVRLILVAHGKGLAFQCKHYLGAVKPIAYQCHLLVTEIRLRSMASLKWSIKKNSRVFSLFNKGEKEEFWKLLNYFFLELYAECTIFSLSPALVYN